MREIELDYPIEGFAILLNEDCILARYFPLIPYKNTLIKRLGEMDCQTQKDCSRLTNAELLQAGLPNEAMVSLFRGFLSLYDVSKQKLKELEGESITEGEKEVLRELFKLPGVRITRAKLYAQAGYTSLKSIAAALPEELIAATTETIKTKQLESKPPLLKEVKTHIAVAKVLTIKDNSELETYE